MIKPISIKDTITLALPKQRLTFDRTTTPTKAELDAVNRMFESSVNKFQAPPHQFTCMLKFLN